jgi:hypothetical protein
VDGRDAHGIYGLLRICFVLFGSAMFGPVGIGIGIFIIVLIVASSSNTSSDSSYSCSNTHIESTNVLRNEKTNRNNHIIICADNNPDVTNDHDIRNAIIIVVFLFTVVSNYLAYCGYWSTHTISHK